MTQRNAVRNPPKGYSWVPALCVGALSLIVYSLTAFRTITWWESADYSLAAITLGVSPAPGSLLLTLIGWMITRIPCSIPLAFRLNLVTVLLATGTVALLSYIAANILSEDRFSNWCVLFAAILGGLTLAFSTTLWGYARQFTPYILTAFFTALILLALTEWWLRAEDKRALSWIFLIFLLFGLDFSVHRTNSLLLPGTFLWIGLRKGKILKSVQGWLTIIAGLVVGLAFQSLTMLLAQRHPFLNICDPSTLPRFWDFVSVKMQGGGWLIHILPRTAPFFRVQIADYWGVFSATFSVVPILFGLTGLIRIFSSDWRKGLGLLTLFLLGSLGAVVYFNVPEHYFRSLDRHYLPSFVLFGFLICFGIAALLSVARRLPRGFREAASLGIIALAAFSPVHETLSGYRRMDGSRNRFAEDFARNALAALPEHAILLTNGDNDTFPLWYVQQVSNYRKDIAVLNISLLNTSWYVEQILDREPKFPLSFTAKEIRSLQPSAWRDTALVIPIPKGVELGLPDSVSVPDSCHWKISSTGGRPYCLVYDLVLMNLLRTNQWNRPIYRLVTVPETEIPWLGSYLRLEGLAWRVMPVLSPPLDRELLRKNLRERCSYRGFADRSIFLDETSGLLAKIYLASFWELAKSQKEAGLIAEYGATLDFVARVLPLDRFRINPEDSAMFEELRRVK